MPNAYCLFVDDSGTRHPDRQRGHTEAFGGWFGLGGVLILESDIPEAEERVAAFRARWPQVRGALHSYEIRNKTKAFAWLTQISAKRRDEFLADLSAMIVSHPIHALACVVDRDGYNARYMKEYGPRRWKLCRTAFSILLERAVKYARHFDAKLRVYVEKSDKVTDGQMRAYYDTVRSVGLPFDAGRSAQYVPLTADDFRSTLYEFRLKEKSSELMQIADLVLWPLCRNGYASTERSYLLLAEKMKLVESLCDQENGLQGTKYSCFDSVARI